MGRLTKFLFRLFLLAFAVLSGYALFAELPAPVREVRITLSGTPAQ